MKSRFPGCEFGVGPLWAARRAGEPKAQPRGSRNLLCSVSFPLAARFLAATFLLVSLCLASTARGQSAPSQNPSTTPPQATSPQNATTTEQLPPGTTICAVLDKTLDTKKAKAGDAIVAKTTMAVLAHGKVVIATGEQVLGHVTRVTVRSGNNAKSEVGVAFDRVVLKDGSQMPLPLTLQAIGYGGLPLPTEDEPASNSPYSATSSAGTGLAGSAARRSNFPPPRPDPSDAPTPAPPGITPGSPILDVGSKGVVGIKGLTLKEGADAGHGSVISADGKNVRLDRGSQLILRVVTKNRSSQFPPILIFVYP